MSQIWQIVKKNMSHKRSPCFYSASTLQPESSFWAAYDLVTPQVKALCGPHWACSGSQISSQTHGTQCGYVHAAWNNLLPDLPTALRHSGSGLTAPPRGCPPWPSVWIRCTALLTPFPSPWLDVFTAHDTIHIILFVDWLFFITWVNSLEAKLQEGWD